MNELRQELKNKSQIKLKDNLAKITLTQKFIADETTRMITVLKENEAILINEFEMIINSYLDLIEYENNLIVYINKQKIEDNSLKQDELIDLNKKMSELKLKLNKLSQKIENFLNTYEFIPKKISNDALLIGEFKQEKVLFVYYINF